uniref:Leucine-rich repeat-containing protein 51 n=2 Tax=Chrysotila carterae TaxID=13221 RepID=A0A7S4BWK9_CHRCT|mmetsp:Transcript_170/g.299  ORF Transcript_170/g.299 Transcript_170/m.299 type:complete len:191 (-) Transcript_170:516-1088(-)
MPDELPTLRNIDVSVNKLSDAAGFERCPALAIATLAHNRICAVSALQPLEALRCLLALDLSGNDVTTIADYRLHTLYPLLLHGVNVGTLDCMPTTTEEKVAAFNLYGHSVAELQDIRLRHFPDPNAEQARLALESAAVSVQSSFRGAAERRTERAATASAVAIQAHARGKHARNACDAMNSIGGVCPPTS